MALEGLANQLSDLARVFAAEPQGEETLEAIVQAAVRLVPGADEASISAIVRRREVVTVVATSELAVRVDRAQYETGEGPCLLSLYEERTVRLPDLAVDGRWPRFARRACGLGVRSMLAVQLFVRDDDLGALNLHSSRPDAFDDESEQVALLFAAHAAVAMDASRREAQLMEAVSTRDVIGTAKGILMERFEVTSAVAFRLLSQQSQNSNQKLHDVAAEVVASREKRAGR